jgi:hypothetical protein
MLCDFCGTYFYSKDVIETELADNIIMHRGEKVIMHDEKKRGKICICRSCLLDLVEKGIRK